MGERSVLTHIKFTPPGPIAIEYHYFLGMIIYHGPLPTVHSCGNFRMEPHKF